MRKEVVLAILVGLTMGLIITYGVYQARLALNRPTDKPVSEETTDDETNNNHAGKLALLNPQDETVQEETAVTVTGTTIPDTFVVVFVNDKESITTSDSSGNFSLELELEEGSNVITVYSIEEDGQTISEERTVIVSDEELVHEETATDSADTDSSTEEDSEEN